MKRVSFPLAFAAGAVALVAIVSGCGDRVAVSPQPSPVRSLTNPTPEESFALIVETFRRGVEDVPVGFVVRREGGHSMMTGRTEVTHELIRPAKQGDPYQATITVERESQYSIQQRRTADESDREDESERRRTPGTLEEPTVGSGVEVLDSDLIGTPNTGGEKRDVLPTPAEGVVQKRPHEAVRTFKLIYENGRWALVTQPDPETEQSISNAFKQALDTQI